MLVLPGAAFLHWHVLFSLPLDGNGNRAFIRNSRMCLVTVNNELSEGPELGEEWAFCHTGEASLQSLNSLETRCNDGMKTPERSVGIAGGGEQQLGRVGWRLGSQLIGASLDLGCLR